MFNWKKLEKIAIKPQEKYLRDENVGPKGGEDEPIHEKRLPHRDGFEQTITEDQINAQADTDSLDIPIIEKALNETAGKYVDHRSDTTWLKVPPMSALVEKMRQARFDKDWEVKKEKHWSQGSEHKTQQGTLPKWPKNAPQHGKIVLENDPDRFSSLKANDTQLTGGDVKPLIGDITTADIDRVIIGIKTGEAVDFDTAIIAILKQAYAEKRELSPVERRAVVDLKIARTKDLLSK
jgi:hypothetical protein